ncbi:trace amine-associated receptor 13c-like [Chanos chanos]|uniref:Trace amine-associated receptor 13c-like n=1 Tax=Chanos chanos TaxID=29144 RepID=A0A6J2W5Y3_CHACN|nr:trace amine-associated receptor 13c-like [Chanos chanos]
MNNVKNQTDVQNTTGIINLENVNGTENCLTLCAEKTISTTVHVLLYMSAVTVVLLTVCGNLLVIISVCHFKKLHTPSNILIFSLAVSDILVGIILMPLRFIWMIESCWFFGLIFCHVYNFFSFHLTSVSVHNVALIAIDRYFALSHYFLYSKEVSKSVMYIVVLFNWMFSLFYNFALLYFNGNFTDLTMCPGECFLVQDEVWSLVDVLIVFVFPCAVIIILYMSIFFIARKHINSIRKLDIQRNGVDGKNAKDSVTSERKAAKVLGILVCVFLACLIPYYVCIFLGNTIQSEFLYNVISNVLIVFYLNSFINPIIYALFYPCFQRSIKLILTCQIFNMNSSLINVLE